MSEKSREWTPGPQIGNGFPIPISTRSQNLKYYKHFNLIIDFTPMNFERFEKISFHTTSLDGIHIRRMTDENL